MFAHKTILLLILVFRNAFLDVCLPGSSMCKDNALHICDMYSNWVVVDCPNKSVCGLKDGVMECIADEEDVDEQSSEDDGDASEEKSDSSSEDEEKERKNDKKNKKINQKSKKNSQNMCDINEDEVKFDDDNDKKHEKEHGITKKIKNKEAKHKKSQKKQKQNELKNTEHDDARDTDKKNSKKSKIKNSKPKNVKNIENAEIPEQNDKDKEKNNEHDFQETITVTKIVEPKTEVATELPKIAEAMKGENVVTVTETVTERITPSEIKFELSRSEGGMILNKIKAHREAHMPIRPGVANNMLSNVVNRGSMNLKPSQNQNGSNPSGSNQSNEKSGTGGGSSSSTVKPSNGSSTSGSSSMGGNTSSSASSGNKGSSGSSGSSNSKGSSGGSGSSGSSGGSGSSGSSGGGSGSKGSTGSAGSSGSSGTSTSKGSSGNSGSATSGGKSSSGSSGSASSGSTSNTSSPSSSSSASGASSGNTPQKSGGSTGGSSSSNSTNGDSMNSSSLKPAESGGNASASASGSKTTETKSSGSASASGSGGGDIGLTTENLSEAITKAGFTPPEGDSLEVIVKNVNEKMESKEEAAMFIAQCIHESGGFNEFEEIKCKENPESCAGEYSSPLGVEGKLYYGRGYIQLSWPENYKAAGEGLGMGDELLNNPDMVAEDPELRIGTAIWYWTENVRNAEGVKDNKFGATTKAINGPLECSGGGGELPAKRYEIYKKVAESIGVENMASEEGC